MRAICTLAVMAAIALAGCATDDDCAETVRVTYELDADPGVPRTSAYVELSLSPTYPTSDWVRIGKRLDDSGRAVFDLPTGQYVWHVVLAPSEDPGRVNDYLWLPIRASDDRGHVLDLPARSMAQTHCDGVRFVK